MHRIRRTLVGTIVTVVVAGVLATSAMALQVGEKAPDFKLPAAGGKQVALSELTAKGPVVLYTFIQAFTSV